MGSNFTFNLSVKHFKKIFECKNHFPKNVERQSKSPNKLVYIHEAILCVLPYCYNLALIYRAPQPITHIMKLQKILKSYDFNNEQRNPLTLLTHKYY